MRLDLPAHQKRARQEFRRFVAERIAPHAGEWERRERVPDEVIAELRRRGWLGAPLPREIGGGGMDAVTYGLLTEEIGRGCSSVRSLLTVHDMTTLALARWGSAEVKERLVPALARGERLGALAMSEPGVGSDAASVETEARRDGDGWVLSGRKKWITYGQIADVFLVFAQADGKPTAFAVEASAPGLERRPMHGVSGTAASLTAELELTAVRVPAAQLVGRIGFGITAVGTTALDLGRYSVAWGSVGIAQACVDACLDYAGERRQFGKPLAQHQLIQRLLTRMIVDTRAARLLCYRAGYLRDAGEAGALMETMVAKYFASRTAVAAANDAVQIHGANGIGSDYPVGRYLRDAKVMEIIEGSTQILETAIAGSPLEEL